VRWVVAGKVTLFGKFYLLSLKLFDLKSRTVAGRVNRRIRGGPEEMKSEISDAAQMLFEKAADRVGVEIIVKTVTTAARHRQLIEESPSAVTVITREDIEASGATTILDLLRMVPGVDVIGASRFFTAITTRLDWTTSSNRFLVLIDGREVNIELLGQVFMELQPIFLEDIERIEVIRGPGSHLYGANALAGVVNITTRAISEETSGWAYLAGGEAGNIVSGARASARMGDWGLSVSGGADVSGTLADPRASGRNVYKFRSVVEYRLSESRLLKIDGGFSRGSGIVPTDVGMFDATMEIGALCLSYKSEDIRGQIYWAPMTGSVETANPLEYNGILLARFVPVDSSAHTVDGEIQWTLPQLWDPLMVIVGSTARVSWLGSDQLLDAETFGDPSSSRYHKSGLSHWEGRGSAFVHAELMPAHWVTVTGGMRFDYNSVTGEFISPRVAAVFRPVADQFIRLGAARSFRKPATWETHAHPMVKFPDESPFQGTGQDDFQEFMTRVIGNSRMGEEKLLSFEAGYLGRFFDRKLTISLDVYYNIYRDVVGMQGALVLDEQGLPDVTASSFQFINNPGYEGDMFGGELTFYYKPSRNISLVASWANRQVKWMTAHAVKFNYPKNLLILGGRIRTPSGLVGSLYAFTRSEFIETGVPNPAGMLEEQVEQKMDNVMLVMGKLGWRFEPREGVEIEAGVKLFLPVHPFSPPYFRYHEKAGMLTAAGDLVGGEELHRMVTGYLEGTF
jgi:iron complex outermembrane receptor protein